MLAHAAAILFGLLVRAGDPPGISLQRSGRAEIPGAEIIAHDAAADLLYVSGSAGIEIVRLGSKGELHRVGSIDAPALSGLGEGATVSHVAIDPAGRSFGAATIIPADNASRPGRIVLFSTRTHRRLAAIPAGFNPDACQFTRDGRLLVCANEGEARPAGDGTILDPPGSITIVDLSRVGSSWDAAMLEESRVRTIEFTDEMVRRATGAGLRINPRCGAAPSLDLEPESIAIVDDMAFVTLQENNAIAIVRLDTGQITAITGLGAIDQPIDGDDRDGLSLSAMVPAMPMPDQISAIPVPGGPALLVTANEGESRDGALADTARLDDLVSSGRAAPADPSAPTRLKVCAFTGDLDGDGLIERPTLPGTRSLSVWDASTLRRAGDTGPAFEVLLALRAGEWYNADISSDGIPSPDARSDDRGPEPEGVCIGRVGERTIAFVGLERPGAIAIVEIRPGGEPVTLDVVLTADDGDHGPEGLAFIPPRDGRPASLIVAFEASGSLSAFRVETPAP